MPHRSSATAAVTPTAIHSTGSYIEAISGIAQDILTFTETANAVSSRGLDFVFKKPACTNK